MPILFSYQYSYFYFFYFAEGCPELNWSLLDMEYTKEGCILIDSMKSLLPNPNLVASINLSVLMNIFCNREILHIRVDSVTWRFMSVQPPIYIDQMIIYMLM